MSNDRVRDHGRSAVLLAEWAYARPLEPRRPSTGALTAWLHIYNQHRHHTAIGGTPITRVSNVAGQYS